MLRKIFIVVFSSLLLGLGCSRGPETATSPVLAEPAEVDSGSQALRFSGNRPRNVLMISIDTLRRDAIGRYGAEASTPQLDGLLAGGVALDDLQSCSNWTVPAFYCALGGFSLHALGSDAWVGRMDFDSGVNGLPERFPWLPKLLRGHGYFTAGVFGNPIVWTMPGLEESFHRFFVRYDPEHPGFAPDDGEHVTNEAMASLEEAMSTPERPWFVHVHYMDPHEPYQPPVAFERRLNALAPFAERPDGDPAAAPLDTKIDERLAPGWQERTAEDRAEIRSRLWARYLGLVEFTDAEIGRLLRGASGMGALEDTLVVLWSDHGEQFGERGRFGHGHQLFIEERGAVGGFSAPGLGSAAWTGPTELVDFPPTIFRALGLPPPDVQAMPGGRAWGPVIGEGASDRLRIASLRTAEGRAISGTQGPNAVFVGPTGRMAVDRASDPSERRPRALSSSGPEHAELFRAVEAEADR